MADTRIPKLGGTSKRAVIGWLTSMHRNSLLFCLDEKPEEIFQADGSRSFSDEESREVNAIVEVLFRERGNDLHDLAFHVISKTFHTQAERRQFRYLYG